MQYVFVATGVGHFIEAIVALYLARKKKFD